MNKGELVDTISEQTGATKKQTDAILTALTGTIIETVSAGEKVTLVGFGSFEARDRKARDGRIHKLGRKSKSQHPKHPYLARVKASKSR